MSGPVLVIELAEAVPRVAIQRLREFLLGASARFEEKRVGEYDLNIQAESLGITDAGAVDGRRPVLVSLMGPGIGDEAIFEAEHADEVDQEPLIGFTPTHAVDVIAFCNSPVDHLVTALLTAAVMDVIGGVANAELREDQATWRTARRRRAVTQRGRVTEAEPEPRLVVKARSGNPGRGRSGGAGRFRVRPLNAHGQGLTATDGSPR